MRHRPKVDMASSVTADHGVSIGCKTNGSNLRAMPLQYSNPPVCGDIPHADRVVEARRREHLALGREINGHDRPRMFHTLTVLWNSRNVPASLGTPHAQ